MASWRLGNGLHQLQSLCQVHVATADYAAASFSAATTTPSAICTHTANASRATLATACPTLASSATPVAAVSVCVSHG